MIYKSYGNTGKKVSAVGFGGMRFDLQRSEEENAELVRYANSQGITYFDTAPTYCENQSEIIFGRAFRHMPKDYYVSTKGMPTKFDTAAKAQEAVKRSLERLGVDRIHFYHVWCLRAMEHYHLAMKPGGQYEGLLRMKEEGLIEHIVFSSHQPGSEIQQIIDEGFFEGVLLGINVLNFPYRWDGVMAAYEKGCGTAAMNPLGGGVIPSHEKELSFIADQGESVVEAALRFVISCPQISICLVGFGSKEHVDVAVRVADTAKPLSEKQLERIKTNIGSHMNAACTGCGYCWDCPQNIAVPSYMQVYNEKQLFGAEDSRMAQLVQHHHNWGLLVGQKARASDCIACGKCEKDCTQHLPIIQRLQEMATWEQQGD